MLMIYMDWIKLKSSDLELVLNKPQLEILKAESLRSAGRDIAAESLDSVVLRIRAEIAASGFNSLDPDHSRIPPELKECALRLAIEGLQVRLPQMELSQMQIRHADYARELLMRVSLGKLPISRPQYSIRTASRKKDVAYGSAAKNATRDSMKGI